MDSNNSELSSASGIKEVTRKYLYEQIKEQNLPSFSENLEKLENNLLECYGHTEESKKNLKRKFSNFKAQIKQRWITAKRREDLFLTQNQAWLEGTFEIPCETIHRQGRPNKLFAESSERTKRRKTEEIRATVDDDIIVHAAQVCLQTGGKRDASKVLKEITNSPTRATKYKKCCNKESESIAPLSPFEALQMFVEADLTRRQYEIIRATNPRHYPCYDLLLKAKQECYPPESALRVSATCAEMELQSLLDHTITRLSIYLEDVLITLSESERQSLRIICKWGCDGSQQARFKQTFSDDADSDANIFLSSFVPLQIVCGEENSKVLWQNPTPSSSRFCRPIRFRFVKESTDVTKEEIRNIRNSTKSLNPTKVNLNGQEYVFGHILKMTMVDGKVCNPATNTKSTIKCYICGATSNDFNDLSKSKATSAEAIEFGISVLHARIRIFESILHLAYRLPVKKYRERKTQEEKELEKQRKTEIQERFRAEAGLLIDMPKANFGNTNDDGGLWLTSRK